MALKRSGARTDVAEQGLADTASLMEMEFIQHG
jgi:hypothetical protein